MPPRGPRNKALGAQQKWLNLAMVEMGISEGIMHAIR